MPSTVWDKARRIRNPLRSLLVALFWLCVWQGISLAVSNDLLIPAPWAVLRRLCGLAVRSDFWMAVSGSLLRMLTGYFAGVACGFLLAFCTHWSRIARQLLAPAFTVIRATPVASFILIALIWIGSARVPVFTAFLMVLPIVWGGVSSGLESIGKELPEAARLFGFSRRRKLWLLYLPSIKTPFLSACVTSVGLAWKASVAAEVLCVSKLSIGKYLYQSKLYLETVDLYAWTCTVIVLSLVLESALKFAVRRSRKEGVPHAE